MAQKIKLLAQRDAAFTLLKHSLNKKGQDFLKELKVTNAVVSGGSAWLVEMQISSSFYIDLSDKENPITTGCFKKPNSFSPD